MGQISLCVCVIVCVFISLGHMQRSGNPGSLGNCMLYLLRNCQTAFQNGCTVSCSHQLCMGILIFPLSCIFVIVFPLDFSHPSEYEVVFDLHLVFDFIVVFICISVMINDFEHLFTWSLVICTSLENVWTCQVVLVIKNLPANAGRHKRHSLDPWIGKIPWRRA